MPRRALFAAIAVMALVLAGCGVKGEPTGAVDPYPTHAVDAAGEPVSIASAPTRIVSADPGATAILHDLGLASATVEATPSTLGTLAADPTTALVVVPLSMDSAALDQLRAASHAPLFRYGADPLADAPTVVTQLGISVGQGPKAAAIAKAMAGGFDALANRLDGEPAVRTLIEGAGFVGYGPTSPVGLDVAAAGGENVVTSNQPLDIAQLPGLDIAAWVSLQPGGSTIASLQKFPELATVPAIAESRVLTVPKTGYPIDAALPAALQALADDLRAAPITTG